MTHVGVGPVKAAASKWITPDVSNQTEPGKLILHRQATSAGAAISTAIVPMTLQLTTQHKLEYLANSSFYYVCRAMPSRVTGFRWYRFRDTIGIRAHILLTFLTVKVQISELVCFGDIKGVAVRICTKTSSSS